MLSEEELQAILGMGDISSAEEQAATQLALAQRLRGAFGQSGRNDIGSNIGRAAGGLAGALSDYRGLSEQSKIPGMRKGFMDAMSEALRRKQAQNAGAQMIGDQPF